MQPVLLGAVLAFTVAALYLRPLGAKDWHVALAGGILAWLLGPLSVRDGIATVAESWSVEAFVTMVGSLSTVFWLSPCRPHNLTFRPANYATTPPRRPFLPTLVALATGTHRELTVCRSAEYSALSTRYSRLRTR